LFRLGVPLNDFVSHLDSMHIINCCVHFGSVGIDKLYGSGEITEDKILMLKLICRINLTESLSLADSSSTGLALIQNKQVFFFPMGQWLGHIIEKIR
jgi:hypothetical protein